ncbi:MAG: hypothetical protein Q8O32_02560 [bacterium]|nr:hypothetical protein [bacterium]
MVKSTSTGPWGRNTLLLYADELGVAFAKMYYGEDKDCSVIITENFKQSVRVNTQYARYNLDLFAQEVANGADPMSMANFYAKTIGQLGPNDADRDFLTEISQQHILECYSQPEKAVIHARTIGLLIDALWHEDKLGHKK